MGTLVCFEDLGAGFFGHRLHVNEVAVVVVDNQHVCVPGDGGLDEAAGEVGEDFAGVGSKVGVNEMELVVGRFRICGVVGVGFVVVVVGFLGGGVAIVSCRRGSSRLFEVRFGFGGSLVGASLIEMAFDEGR